MDGCILLPPKANLYGPGHAFLLFMCFRAFCISCCTTCRGCRLLRQEGVRRLLVGFSDCISILSWGGEAHQQAPPWHVATGRWAGVIKYDLLPNPRIYIICSTKTGPTTVSNSEDMASDVIPFLVSFRKLWLLVPKFAIDFL